MFIVKIDNIFGIFKVSIYLLIIYIINNNGK